MNPLAPEHAPAQISERDLIDLRTRIAAELAAARQAVNDARREVAMARLALALAQQHMLDTQELLDVLNEMQGELNGNRP